MRSLLEVKIMNMKKKIIFSLIIIFSKINVFAAEYVDTFGSETNCNSILDLSFRTKLNDYFFTPIKVIAPILLIVFTSIDFAKVVFSDGKDDLPKAGKNFMKRAIATLIIFFAKDIINFILGLGGLNLCL